MSGTAQASAVTGKTEGKVDTKTLRAAKSGTLTGVYNGAFETAPKHIYVRYLIRAKN